MPIFLCFITLDFHRDLIGARSTNLGASNIGLATTAGKSKSIKREKKCKLLAFMT